MRSAFIKSLTQEASRNPNIVLLTGDLGFTVFEDFQKKFPRRFFNMGVSEANMMGVAAGMALSGLVPFVYSIATFASLRALEQIRDDICLHQANVKIVGSGAGLSYGHAGSTHHALEDIAVMRSLPNMTIVCPSDSLMAEVVTKEIISLSGPVYLRLGKRGEPVIYKHKPKVKIGKGIILKEGRDIAIIATGNIVHHALEASLLLTKKGIDCAVIDMHTIKPIDKKLVLNLLFSAKALFTLEEHHITGGLGSAVAEIISESDQKNIYFKRLGLPDIFVRAVGSQEYLRAFYGLTPDKIAQKIISLIKI